jgi:hypothetical protein
MLLDKYLWFSGVSELNDPLEFKVKYTRDKNQVKFSADSFVKFISKLEPYKNDHEAVEGCRMMLNDYLELMELFYRNHFERESNKLGIYCFTEVPNDILMWSHYADSHKGVLIEFDLVKLFRTLTNKNKGISFEFDWVDYVNCLPELNIGLITKNELRAEFKKKFFNKLDKWNYEKEIRVLSTVKGKINFDTKSIIGIIKGCKMPSEIFESLTAIINKMDVCPNLKIKSAKLNYENGEIYTV